MANLLHCNPSSNPPSPPDICAVLNSLSLDTLGLRESAVAGMKAICEDEDGARLVEELRAQAVEDGSMKRAGIKAEMGEDGKVKMVKR